MIMHVSVLPSRWCRSTQIKNVHMPISHYQMSVLREPTRGVYLGICTGPCGVSLPYSILFWNNLKVILARDKDLDLFVSYFGLVGSVFLCNNLECSLDHFSLYKWSLQV